MRRFLLSFIATTLCAIPAHSFAAVVINEVAWMGTTVSADDEWVELYNQETDSVDLSGWILQSRDGTPRITLNGSIPGNGFFVLERTDDASAPGVSAGQIYSGAMSNAGETLVLVDTLGVEVDVADGGGDWEALGGDNATKHTAQRQIDGTWITGEPTPGQTNSSTDTESDEPTKEGEVAGSSTTVESARGSRRPANAGYRQFVYAYAGEDMRFVAGSRIPFYGYTVDQSGRRVSGAAYRWSFGDGGSQSGEVVSHTYHIPGTYLATVSVAARHQRAKDSVVVVVEPANVSIGVAEYENEKHIVVTNHDTKELDVSGWRLTVSDKKRTLRKKGFTIPEGTVIAASSSVPFAEEITGLSLFTSTDVALLFPNGTVAALYDHGAVPEEKNTLSSRVLGVSVSAPIATATPIISIGENKASIIRGHGALAFAMIGFFVLILFLLSRPFTDVAAAARGFTIVER